MNLRLIKNLKLKIKNLLFFLSAFLIAGGGILIYAYLHSKPVQAAWFDDSWAYRTPLTITHNASATNQKVKFDIDTATLTTDKLQADCGDSRFTDTNGKLLRYFIDSSGGACDTASTDYYVLIPTINNGTTTIYHYYGNPSAPNGTETANFSEGTLTPSTGITAGTEAQGPGPVGYWKFDDGQGSTAQDSTSSNYDGTITGATWQSEDKCISGKCLFFTSATDRIAAGTSNNLNISSGDATYETWVRLTAATFYDNTTNWTLFSNESYQATGMIIRIDGETGKLMYRSSQAAASTSFTTTSVPITSSNTWYHIATVKSGTTISFYVNGNFIQSGTITNPVSTANAFTIGSAVGGSQSVRGFMDDAKVYNFARTAAQILQDYNSGLANSGTKQGSSAVLGASTEKWLSDGLAGYWKIDESSGNATDSSGNGTTLTNNNITTFTTGKFGNASSYNGTNQYFSTASTISGVQTVAFWVYPSSATDNFLNLTSSAYVNSSSGTVSATGFTLPSIYVNGVLNGALTANAWNLVVVTTGSGISANQIEVGRANNSYLSNTSKMDEVRIYNRALSSKEISDLYNWAPGPVGYWNFDEKSGASTFDTSGGGNTGTITNATWNTGKFGSGLSFDGNGDFVNIPQTTTLDTPTGTVSMWAYFSDLTDNGYLWSQNADEWNIYNNGTQLRTYYDSTAVSTYTPTFTNNQWVHLSFTFTKGGTCYFYVNGVQVDSDTCSSTAPTLSNTHIGSISSSGSYAFNGKIDDVRVYNYQRSAKQVVSDMNAGHPAVGSPVGSSVGYWKFDEGYGTTANDSTPNDNDLILSSASWTNSGKFGKAWNGTGAIWGSRADDADFDLAENEDFTVSLWYKSDSVNNPGAIEYLVNKANATTAGYAVYADTSGYLCFGIDDDATWGPDIASCTTTDLYDNSWHHLAAVRDYSSSDKTYIYIDGVSRDSDSDSTTATLANSLSLYTGDRDGTDNGDEFNGDLDEIKIYRYALTADEVKTEYNRGSSLVLGALSDSTSGNQVNSAAAEYCIPGDSTTCTAPVARWDFEERTGANAYDTSGNGRTGTITEAVWTNGKVGAALNFDGSNDVVTVDDNDVLDMTTTMSFETWVYPTATSAYDPIIGKVDSSYNTGYEFANSSGTLRTTIRATAGNCDYSIGTLTANTWQHVASTYDGTYTRHYINGVLQGTSTSCTYGSTANALSLLIAGRGSDSSKYIGKIDQVRIFNYARSAAQIAWDYNRGKPVGHWKLDDCQGTTAGDSSGNGYSGTITIGASGEDTLGTCTTSSTAWGSGATGKRNYSLSLDGTDDYVLVADNDNLSFTNKTMTINAWIKGNVVTGDNGIVVKRATSNFEYGFYVSDSKLSLNLWTAASASVCSTVGSATLSTNTWYFVTAVADGTNCYLYLNGVRDGTAGAISGTVSNGTAGVYIGYDNSGVARYLNGQIDDVKIFNYALTAAQVKNMMNDGAVRFGPSSSAP